MRSIIRGITIVLALTELASGAQLTSGAAQAWEQYVSTRRAQMEDRLRENGKPFLWVQESDERMRSVDGGVIVSEPVGRNGRLAVPGALIHHWIGAVFVPHVTAAEVREKLDQYSNYPEYYKPNVVRCRLISRDDYRRAFSMTWQVRSVGVSAVIDADYEAQYFLTSPATNWSSFSRSTRVQEIDNYGRDDERPHAVGAGTGYLWSVCSIMRVAQIEDGSVIEIEAIALSRDVPAAIAWFANPIISRVSRNSLRTTLQNTRAALTGPSAMTLASLK
jgi:hypothetical protein